MDNMGKMSKPEVWAFEKLTTIEWLNRYRKLGRKMLQSYTDENKLLWTTRFPMLVEFHCYYPPPPDNFTRGMGVAVIADYVPKGPVYGSVNRWGFRKDNMDMNQKNKMISTLLYDAGYGLQTLYIVKQEKYFVARVGILIGKSKTLVDLKIELAQFKVTLGNRRVDSNSELKKAWESLGSDSFDTMPKGVEKAFNQEQMRKRTEELQQMIKRAEELRPSGYLGGYVYKYNEEKKAKEKKKEKATPIEDRALDF